MGLESRYPDILQNIESIIASNDRQEADMRDLHAIKALEALEEYFRKIVAGKEPALGELEGPEQKIFAEVLAVLSLRSEISGDASPPSRRGFSRALREPSQEEIYLACIRKILNSSKHWTRQKGERGYLDFIGRFV